MFPVFFPTLGLGSECSETRSLQQRPRHQSKSIFRVLSVWSVISSSSAGVFNQTSLPYFFFCKVSYFIILITWNPLTTCQLTVFIRKRYKNQRLHSIVWFHIQWCFSGPSNGSFLPAVIKYRSPHHIRTGLSLHRPHFYYSPEHLILWSWAETDISKASLRLLLLTFPLFFFLVFFALFVFFFFFSLCLCNTALRPKEGLFI